MTTRIVKPAKCESEMVCQPIAPCEILQNGCPGTMLINGTEYAVSIVGHLPATGEPVVDGYRMTKANGESHDLCLVAGRLECTCGDYEFRRATRDPRGCKHIVAAKRHLQRPRDLCPTPPAPACNYVTEFDDP